MEFSQDVCTNHVHKMCFNLLYTAYTTYFTQSIYTVVHKNRTSHNQR